MKRIEIEIGELVLHGFAPADQLSIASAVKQELARLVTERGIEQRATISRKDPRSFRVAANADGKGIGRQAARAIHGGLAGTARR